MGAFANKTEQHGVTQVLFGKSLKSGAAWTTFALRLGLGFLFLWGGYEKMATKWGGLFWPGTTKTMATAGFLGHAVSGPFATLFNGLSGNPAIEYLVVYGELAIGISLMFGLFSRIGAISGVLMNLLFYLAQLPVQNNPVVNEYVVYMLVFALFIFVPVGRFLGVDGILQNLGAVERRPILRKILTTIG